MVFKYKKIEYNNFIFIRKLKFHFPRLSHNFKKINYFYEFNFSHFIKYIINVRAYNKQSYQPKFIICNILNL